ncbi:hypothetical protein ANO14919_092170 [Xylariales sp. No.14919]|nr:hypothetical protein ANO14919_092170 [Xylariales sp. No.14919]
MQRTQDVRSRAGDEELRRVVEGFMASSERYQFVVGPPRSGKSTRLPLILAALSQKRVISVQPDDWVARYHAEWVRSSEATATYGGERPSVGCYADDDEFPSDFVPGYDVSYVSYRWLYRLVVGINTPEPSTGLDNEHTRAKAAERARELLSRRSRYEGRIGYVILDEVHAQSVTQELGYLAVNATGLGVVQAPIGFSDGTKVVAATAYPENNAFFNYFALPDDQVVRQTFAIVRGLAPAGGNTIRQEFVAEGPSELPEYHKMAVQKAREILHANRDARILLLMDTPHSPRNLARQAALPAIDLETEAGRSQMSQVRKGRVVLATPSFASRIPVDGITDVICPPTQSLPMFHEKLHRQVQADVYLTTWEFEWAKNHLDRACERPTIHYVFRQSELSKMGPVCGARWASLGDFVDIFLGLIRLCPKNAMPNAVPHVMRIRTPVVRGEAALTQLTRTPILVIPAPRPPSRPPPYYQLHYWLVSQTTLKLVDRCSLERRAALFLGELEQVLVDKGVGARNQRFATMVAAAMVAFDESPILRRRGPHKPGEDAAEGFGDLRGLFHLGLQKDLTSDPWINAVVWMDLKRRAAAARSEVAAFALKHHRSKTVFVDAVPLRAAEPRLRLLARVLGLDGPSQDALCDGSFLEEVERFQKTLQPASQVIVEYIWAAYFGAYKYNLAYVEMETVDGRPTPKMIDISSNTRTDYAWKHLVVDLYEQWEVARRHKKPGFYVTGSVLMGHARLRSLTVVPYCILTELLVDTEGSEGVWSLDKYLAL